MIVLFNVLALLSLCATALMHWVGSEYALYWVYQWWDVPTHMLGGLTAGLWFVAVSFRLKLSFRQATFFILGLTFAVGVAWEIWEAIAGLGGGWGGYWFDTIKDLCDDMLGALGAWAAFSRAKR